MIAYDDLGPEAIRRMEAENVIAVVGNTPQGSRPEDARKDGRIRGRSGWFVHNAG